MIWTRDPATADTIAAISPPRAGCAPRPTCPTSFLPRILRRPPAAGRLAVVLNFDYAAWPALRPALAALDAVPARERIWLARNPARCPAPSVGCIAQLPPAEQARWQPPVARRSRPPLTEVLARWPGAEWILSSRFHATLAAAWSGSRAVVISTNAKLAAAALECGYPALAPDANPARLAATLREAPIPSPTHLAQRAAAARQSVAEFAAAIGLPPRS